MLQPFSIWPLDPWANYPFNLSHFWLGIKHEFRVSSWRKRLNKKQKSIKIAAQMINFLLSFFLNTF